MQEAEIPFFSEGSAIGEPDYVFELEEEYFIEKNSIVITVPASSGLSRYYEHVLK